MTPLVLYALQGCGITALLLALIWACRQLVVGPERTVAERRKDSWS